MQKRRPQAQRVLPRKSKPGEGKVAQSTGARLAWFAWARRRWHGASPYVRLARLDRPIGIWLLAWPMLWSLWLAGEGSPRLASILVFFTGAVLMRSAGCVVNDLLDRKLDGHVSRTRSRPLVSGEVTPRAALVLLVILLAMAALLLLYLTPLAQALALIALVLALTYPLAKRWTYLPQLQLGLAFGMGIPIAWATEASSLTAVTALLFVANVLWTLAYDTLYAMADREDDLKIGVRSTAILFGELDLLIIGTLQILTLLTLALAGARANLDVAFHLSLLIAAALFAAQQFRVRDRQPAACIAAFKDNQWVGAVVFIGIVLGQ